jgi:uncharacterized SAM-binding protein YcdF (DUF218 family)
MKRVGIVLLVLLASGALLFFTSGGFLVVNRPEHADAIVVLAGETDRRPALGLRLLQEGYAPQLVLDVPANARIYDRDQLQLAQQYVQSLPQAHSVSICPIYGLSTKTEAEDVLRCLKTVNVGSVLVVTSDYHTRRALSTFRHELLGMQVSVAAASDPMQFGGDWWKHRQWAKMNFEEWLRFVWWQVVDRWR